MANEQLRAAMNRAGLDADGLADRVDVDPKTVPRWLSGRVPHPRMRLRIATALGCELHELWPDTDKPPPPAPTGEELIASYPDASAPGAPDPLEILRTAVARIDLLDPTLTHLLDQPGMLELLLERAKAGCRIRILLSAPDSGHLLIAEAERHPDVTPVSVPELAREAERAHQLIAPLLEEPGVEARAFVAVAYNSILRADETMLIAPHLYATTPDRAPLLHLERRGEDGLFDRFLAHYDTIWEHAARPLPPPAADPTASQ